MPKSSLNLQYAQNDGLKLCLNLSSLLGAWAGPQISYHVVYHKYEAREARKRPNEQAEKKREREKQEERKKGRAIEYGADK